jgi:hypothetical protein
MVHIVRREIHDLFIAYKLRNCGWHNITQQNCLTANFDGIIQVLFNCLFMSRVIMRITRFSSLQSGIPQFLNIVILTFHFIVQTHTDVLRSVLCSQTARDRLFHV